jgi:hypothetical protein
MLEGGADHPTARVSLNDDSAWKLLFNALSSSEAEQAVGIRGLETLAAPLMRARSVIV